MSKTIIEMDSTKWNWTQRDIENAVDDLNLLVKSCDLNSASQRHVEMVMKNLAAVRDNLREHPKTLRDDTTEVTLNSLKTL